MMAWDPFSPTRSKNTGDQANFTLVKLSHNFLFQLWHVKSLEASTAHWHQLHILVGYSSGQKTKQQKKDLQIFSSRFFSIHVQNHLLDSLLQRGPVTPTWSCHTALGHSPNMCLPYFLPMGWHPRSHLLLHRSPSSSLWSSNTHAGFLLVSMAIFLL